ncbi:ATP-binding cassette domain-containing protein [Marivivens sp. LCG002]|uniref:ABC transporter ATP-binding protein n=1 Tax=Marivivens sp. LCG002 TaxID=3051171 RepID=UPI0025549C9D|nr:ATP-binding cassette domain-containing protein [Marivivens sp. LCG002]WIV51759.1 ATP-binding cassette domain-containing protein [Marivivens sp. LCG002]
MQAIAQGTAPLSAEEQSPLLSLSLESFGFGSAPILGALSFDIAAGESVALRGESGIGKTTLLRLVAGLEVAPKSRLIVNGRMGMVFQEPHLLRWRSVLRNITLTTGVDDRRALTLLDQVGLIGKEALFPDQLSLGQQRRLAIARAFAVEPDLLLLDEPFVSLDAELADQMMGLLESLRAIYRPALLLVTHDDAEAERLTERAITLGGHPASIISDVKRAG